MALNVSGGRSSSLKSCHQLKKTLQEAMKTYVSVAEDMQDGGDKFSDDVSKMEKLLLEAASLENELQVLEKAVKKAGEVEREYTSGDQREQPPQLEMVMEEMLMSLKEEGYDPKTHLQWSEFVERVRGEEVGVRDDEDADIVMAQVQRSLKCPLTQQYLEDPVTNSCGHSYSHTAINLHIRNCGQRGVAKCPVCNTPITNLVPDHRLKRLVRKAIKRDQQNMEEVSAVSL